MIPQPVRVCQQLYGVQNVNDVRDAVINSFRRFFGYESEWQDPRIYQAVQSMMVQVLADAGRNPRAIRLALPPDRIMPNPFPTYYAQTGGDKDKAYSLAASEVMSSYPPSLVKQALLNIYIDYHSV
jgi:hypothetical protein